jgi:hypothetical protein
MNSPDIPPRLETPAHSVDQLPAHWRATAEMLQAHGADGPAAAYGFAAEQLESSMLGVQEELLSLTGAARECGFSTRTLHRWLKTGQLRSVGRSNAPKIRRGDLMNCKFALRKPPDSAQLERASIEQIVRAIVTNTQDGYGG